VSFKRELILGFCLLLLALPALAEVKILGVEVEPHKYYDNIYIKTSGDITPKVRLYGDRLILDFKGAQVEKGQKIAVAKSSRLAGIRIGQFQKDTARVVFDLKRSVKYDFATIYNKEKVWVEVADSKENLPMVAMKPPPEEKPKKGITVVSPPKYPEKAATIEVAAKVKEFPRTKAKPVAKRLALRNKVIVVDPGHGGDDPGAIGPGKIWEKDLNLKVSFYLADYLKSKGATVFLTRSTDVKKSLREIVNFSNRIGADAYIGVHFNSIDNSGIGGTETYYYTPQSVNLAQMVHHSLLKGLRREDRGIRRAMFYTIHHAQMPAVIVEPVYMTHSQDGLLIKSKSFQKEVARDIALGVTEVFK
jgi:N-acetylmuramoyl-L-alanine amidase